MLNVIDKIPLPILNCGSFLLRPYRLDDAPSLQRNINNKEVARDVSNIPFPYTLLHAESWVRTVEDCVTPLSKRIDFVIDVNGEVAGSVAFINIDKHKAQVSSWVSPVYWRQGLAVGALKKLVQFGFEVLGLVRIYAYHYSENQKTAGLLEKVGFKFEGVHCKEWLKIIDGEQRLFDSNYYSIVKDALKVKKVAIAYAEGPEYHNVQSLS
jgi:ribosomal-protein-alanine N-acetyltransferase